MSGGIDCSFEFLAASRWLSLSGGEGELESPGRHAILFGLGVVWFFDAAVSSSVMNYELMAARVGQRLSLIHI